MTPPDQPKKRTYMSLNDHRTAAPPSSRRRTSQAPRKHQLLDLPADFPMLEWTPPLISVTTLESDTFRKQELLGTTPARDPHAPPKKPAVFPAAFKVVLDAFRPTHTSPFAKALAVNNLRLAIFLTLTPLLNASRAAADHGLSLTPDIIQDVHTHLDPLHSIKQDPTRITLVGLFCDLLASNPVTLIPAFGTPEDHIHVLSSSNRHCLFPNPLVTKTPLQDVLRTNGIFVPNHERQCGAPTHRMVNTGYLVQHLNGIRLGSLPPRINPKHISRFKACHQIYSYVIKNLNQHIAHLDDDSIIAPINDPGAQEMIRSFIPNAQFPTSIEETE